MRLFAAPFSANLARSSPNEKIKTSRLFPLRKMGSRIRYPGSNRALLERNVPLIFGKGPGQRKVARQCANLAVGWWQSLPGVAQRGLAPELHSQSGGVSQPPLFFSAEFAGLWPRGAFSNQRPTQWLVTPESAGIAVAQTPSSLRPCSNVAIGRQLAPLILVRIQRAVEIRCPPTGPAQLPSGGRWHSPRALNPRA